MTKADLGDLGPLWLVGCGNMGGALLSRWLECGLPADQVTVIDPSPRGLPEGVGIRVLAVPPEDGAPKIIVLAVKPQMLGVVAKTIRTCAASGGGAFVSILAGTSIETLSGLFPDCCVVRAMPNSPARLGKGVTALFATTAAPPARASVERLMLAAGTVHWLDSEAQFDAVTGVSGSGPAYVFRMIEALEHAGVGAGLPEQLAAALARETVVGAAALVAESSASPAALRAQVTSPNGTTQAGLEVLDGDGELSDLMQKTVAAATNRSRELGQGSSAVLEKPLAKRLLQFLD